jgi:hypothetical protein
MMKDTHFSLDASHHYWSMYQDPSVYKAILNMETQEHWTLDGHPEIESSLDEYYQYINNKNEITNKTGLIRCLAVIKSSRVLYLMQIFDKSSPGFASSLLNYANENKNQEKWIFLFIQRNLIFERLRLIHRLFNKERLDFIQEALEGES